MSRGTKIAPREESISPAAGGKWRVVGAKRMKGWPRRAMSMVIVWRNSPWLDGKARMAGLEEEEEDDEEEDLGYQWPICWV